MTQFLLTESLDMALLLAALLREPWNARHGTLTDVWNQILKDFIQTTKFIAYRFDRPQTRFLSERTVQDRFDYLMRARKSKN